MRVRVLGPFEADGPHGPCVVAGARQRTVLAVLALHAGRPVTIGRLIDAVWPDDPPPSARNSLQSHVARLRAVLPGGVLRHEPAGYRLLLAPEQVDALCFERLLSEARTGSGPAGRAELLDRALALWRGPALPEFPAGPLAGWAARLGAAHRTALADRAELGGGSDRLAAEVAADPCWERGALLLARMVPAAEATAVLRGHAEAVVEALGLDPSPAVRALQAELARGAGASAGTGFGPAGVQPPRAGPEVAAGPRC